MINPILHLRQVKSSECQIPGYAAGNMFHKQIATACGNHDLVLFVPVLPAASFLTIHLLLPLACLPKYANGPVFLQYKFLPADRVLACHRNDHH